jgi:hypothetical protein
VLGGFASVAGGGKFANGAITGAFGYLYNECGNGGCTGARYVYDEPALPESPPDVDLNYEVKRAQQLFPNGFGFYDMVNNGGEWDWKHYYGSQYEDFGNFFYGLVAKAFGFPNFIIYNEAGINQFNGPNAGPREWGEPASRFTYFGLGGASPGIYPYGDDPWDRYWISRGIRYYNASK